MIRLADFINDIKRSPLSPWSALNPWELVAQAPEVVLELLKALSPDDYEIRGDVAVHKSTIVEQGAVLKGPLILGPRCFVAAGAYLRGGCWVDEGCTFGPGAELKTSIVFAGTKLAHFNFVGDSVLGTGVNLEAGSIVCNYRNERDDKHVQVRIDNRLIATGCDKFGALIGDQSRIGANAVLAPGALLTPGSVVRRGALFDAEVGELNTVPATPHAE
ncbi:LbetaH domain-containing protein [Pseudomonas huanghezhanensis]|uniref:LpxA family transferase n=1 Tax=Pseudomonas huanghezhanensis TaxID=3002903 RepID=UPI0022858F74|nr:LpxA family transferase [Pseudomonas sp. BSw22131]